MTHSVPTLRSSELADEKEQGTGSGFGSARRIIETLRGSLKIGASSAAGTEIRVVLPAAFASVTPVSAEALQARLDGWTLLDFDDRTAFEAGLKASVAPDRTIDRKSTRLNSSH